MKIPEAVCPIGKIASSDNKLFNTVRFRRISPETCEATATDGKMILSVRWQDANLAAPGDDNSPPMVGDAILPRAVVAFLRTAMVEERRTGNGKPHAVRLGLHYDGATAGIIVETVAGLVQVFTDQKGMSKFPPCDPILQKALARQAVPCADPATHGTMPVMLGIPLMLTLMERLRDLDCWSVRFFFPVDNAHAQQPIAFRATSEDSRYQVVGCLMGVNEQLPLPKAMDLWGMEAVEPKQEKQKS